MPVSNLFLFGRKADLAFEKPLGDSPRERHHVRFWRTEKTHAGRPAWIGSAAFDIGVELSRTTGQVTHHISPDSDAERAGRMVFKRSCRARMYEQLMRRSPIEIRVFSQLGSAAKWLEVPVEILAP